VGAIFGSDLLVVFLVALFGIGTLVIPIWAFVDAASHSAGDFYEIGSNRASWIGVLGVTFFLGFGIVLGLFYLGSVRPKLQRLSHLS
jgi:hypothetical protein